MLVVWEGESYASTLLCVPLDELGSTVVALYLNRIFRTFGAGLSCA
jgi:hypothetical protein